MWRDRSHIYGEGRLTIRCAAHKQHERSRAVLSSSLAAAPRRRHTRTGHRQQQRLRSCCAFVRMGLSAAATPVRRPPQHTRSAPFLIAMRARHRRRRQAKEHRYSNAAERCKRGIYVYKRSGAYLKCIHQIGELKMRTRSRLRSITAAAELQCSSGLGQLVYNTCQQRPQSACIINARNERRLCGMPDATSVAAAAAASVAWGIQFANTTQKTCCCKNCTNGITIMWRRKTRVHCHTVHIRLRVAPRYVPTDVAALYVQSAACFVLNCGSSPHTEYSGETKPQRFA